MRLFICILYLCHNLLYIFTFQFLVLSENYNIRQETTRFLPRTIIKKNEQKKYAPYLIFIAVIIYEQRSAF